MRTKLYIILFLAILLCLFAIVFGFKAVSKAIASDEKGVWEQCIEDEMKHWEHMTLKRAKIECRYILPTIDDY